MKKIITAMLITTTALTAAVTVAVADSSSAYTGYVLYTGTVIADVNGITQQTQGAVIVQPDGTTETVATIHDRGALLGSVVTVTPSDFGATLSSPALAKAVTGTVNAAAKTIGTASAADGIKIIDIAAQPFQGSRDYAVIDLNRIDGLTLDSSDIKYCKTDAAGRISELYLNDVTGDAYTYGIVDKIDTRATEMTVFADGGIWRSDIVSPTAKRYSAVRISKDYSYDIDMDTREGNLTYHDDEYYQFSAVASLYSYGSASSVANGTAVIGADSYKLSDDIAVYYAENMQYVQTSLESVSNGHFKLTCYYDKSESEGGRIRVIVAERK